MIDLRQFKSREISKKTSLSLYNQYDLDTILTTKVQQLPEHEIKIPNNLFFLWFGSELPKWATLSIEYYKELNPDFNIRVFNEFDLMKSNDSDIIDCLDKINQQKTFYYEYFNRWFAANKLSDKFNVRFSDVFRVYLLNTYGGIYLDCDTWPVKPFDDELLTNVSVMYSRLCGAGDIFFLGSQKNCAETMFSWDDIGVEHLSPSTTNIGIMDAQLYFEDERFIKMRDKFINCQLSKDEHFNGKNFYIDHFASRTWNQGQY